MKFGLLLLLAAALSCCVSQKSFHMTDSKSTDQPSLIQSYSPTYPTQAAYNKVEGFVVVGFTVTEAGSVKDVIVLEEYPAGVFSDSAKSAAKNWKYQPRKIEGEPVETTNWTALIKFILPNKKQFSEATCEKMQSTSGRMFCTEG